MASEDDRKRRIMEHLARSNGDYIKRSTSTSSRERKQQILDHVRQSMGG
ncbi:hypothetical protein K9N68_27225 [Kovacikia minuta CCNUW1]|nr:hypothetical protein [Kovacikia minuta]UBF25271.1 hypothetical protein K9N68_27225 [Kovacikia minuta CCNUW1]